MYFSDREQAGRLLAQKLERFAADHPIVVGLPRGGVPVAYEVARALGAVLDVVVVRKFGARDFPEYAIGAVAEGGAICLNVEAVRELMLSEQEVAAMAGQEVEEINRRARLYREGRFFPDVAGHTAIIVDDGVATGASSRAAARALRQRRAGRVVLAAPVIAAGAMRELQQDFDEVVAIETPAAFYAVSAWYARFPQVTDAEVLETLHSALAAEPPEGLPGELWNGEWIDDQQATADPPRIAGETPVSIPTATAAQVLEGDIFFPSQPRGIVVFAHGSGSSRHSPRDRVVAAALRQHGFATLLFDLLTPAERAEDATTRALRSDVELLTSRIVATLRWVAGAASSLGLRVGCVGAGTGAAAVLAAAALRPELLSAIVSRAGRTDLVDPPVLDDVGTPVLLIVGAKDQEQLVVNRLALGHLQQAELAVVPGAGRLFEEPGALDAMARQAAEWFGRYLASDAAHSTTGGFHVVS